MQKPHFFIVFLFYVSLYVVYTLMYVSVWECDALLCVFIYYLLIREYKSKDRQVSVSGAQ